MGADHSERVDWASGNPIVSVAQQGCPLVCVALGVVTLAEEAQAMQSETAAPMWLVRCVTTGRGRLWSLESCSHVVAACPGALARWPGPALNLCSLKKPRAPLNLPSALRTRSSNVTGSFGPAPGRALWAHILLQRERGSLMC